MLRERRQKKDVIQSPVCNHIAARLLPVKGLRIGALQLVLRFARERSAVTESLSMTYEQECRQTCGGSRFNDRGSTGLVGRSI